MRSAGATASGEPDEPNESGVPNETVVNPQWRGPLPNTPLDLTVGGLA